MERVSADGTCPGWHVRLALRLLAGAVLSGRPAAEAAAVLLRQPVRDHRAERGLLPDTNPGSGRSVARTDRPRLRLRLEGVQIHHALEAPDRSLRKQPGAAGRPHFIAAWQGRTDSVSASTAVRGESRQTRLLLQAAVAETPLQLRVSSPELVSAP